MKAIVNGVRYDTEKASLIGEHCPIDDRRDFGWFREQLYKTPRSGRYFISGEGNARSPYATSLGGGSWIGGEKIIPLKGEAEAFAWAQRNLDADTVEQHFGHLIEDA